MIKIDPKRLMLLNAWKNDLIMYTKKWVDVPEKYKKSVLQLLCDDVKNNKLTSEQYMKITGENFELIKY